LLKIVGMGAYFFYDRWNTADFLIISVSVIEEVISLVSSGKISTTFLTSLRLFRIFRVTRLVSLLEQLNIIVNAFFLALTRVFWVALLMGVCIYTFAVLATGFFKDMDGGTVGEPGSFDFQDYFGNVGRSSASLIQMLSFDSWTSGIARPVGDIAPLAWLFFLPFVLLCSLGLLNLLTAVFVDSLQEANRMNEVTNLLNANINTFSKAEHIAELFQEISQGALRISQKQIDDFIERWIDNEAAPAEERMKWIAAFEEIGITMDNRREFNEVVQAQFLFTEGASISRNIFLECCSKVYGRTIENFEWRVERMLEKQQLEIAMLRTEVGLLRSGDPLGQPTDLLSSLRNNQGSTAVVSTLGIVASGCGARAVE